MVDKENSEKHRILIVDDNHNIYKDFQAILIENMDSTDLDAMAAEYFGETVNATTSQYRYELDYAAQGKDGVELVKTALSQNHPFALAFVDMRMPPGWDGLETINHLWQADPDVQVVICTAYSDYSWEEISNKVGRTDKLLILKKPFDAVEVAQLASALTQKWSLAGKAIIKMDEIEQMVQKRTVELAKTNEHLELEIAERIKTEETLKVSNQKILEQQKSVIEEERLNIVLQMAGATAHELNQPLINFLGNIDLLKSNRNDPKKMTKNFEALEALGEQISGIVGKIQNLHHDQPGIRNVPLSALNLDQKINILSVEDSDVDFALIKALLKKAPHITLIRAKTIEESLESIEKKVIDIILLDYLLPDGNGLDLIRAIEQKNISTPVVVITGQGDEMVASQVIQAGAYDYLPKDRISVKVLSRIIVNTLEKARLKKEIEEAHKKMAMMSTEDELTGLYNRRYFSEALEREVSRAKRYGTILSLCIADIDHFKGINDTYSHLAGDMILSEVGRLMKHSFRFSDLICRWGGEEFAIILPSTAPENAIKACEKFRKSLAKQRYKYKKNHINITISIGIAVFDETTTDSFKGLLSMADKALYQAKKDGRNKVVVWTDRPEISDFLEKNPLDEITPYEH